MECVLFRYSGLYWVIFIWVSHWEQIRKKQFIKWKMEAYHSQSLLTVQVWRLTLSFLLEGFYLRMFRRKRLSYTSIVLKGMCQLKWIITKSKPLYAVMFFSLRVKIYMDVKMYYNLKHIKLLSQLFLVLVESIYAFDTNDTVNIFLRCFNIAYSGWWQKSNYGNHFCVSTTHCISNRRQ